MTTNRQWTGWAMIAALMLSGSACAADNGPVSVRKETYPRPPYSQATYYIYEQSGAVICTKLAVCDKYDACDVSYHAGAFYEPKDTKAGKPSDGSAAVTIAQANLRKHQCLAEVVPDVL